MTRVDDGHAGPRMNILLVDDELANLLVLPAILEDLSQNLVEARGGEEALQRLLEDDFAVVLLDGFETARRIRSRKRSRQTPINFFIAFEDNRLSAEQAHGLGAVDYLVKPLVPTILQASHRDHS